MISGRSRRIALWGVIGADFIVGTGVGSVIPILPLFLRERGGSYGLVGVIVGANLVANAIGQYPAGRLADRFGRAPLMIGGLLLSGISYAGFLLPVSIGWFFVLRFVSGLGGAAFRPGTRAAIADLSPEGQRGAAYGWLMAAETSGLIIGPALGGVLAVFGRDVVFEVTAVAMGLAAVVLATTLRGLRLEPHGVETGRSATAGSGPLLENAAVRGVLLLAASLGFIYGIYSVVWSLFMKSIGASDWQVGLSFSLFALPLLLTAPLGGWASDRFDRRWLGAASVGSTAILAPVYPLLHSVPAVIGVGVVEASSAAFTAPAMNAYLMSSVAAQERGRAAGAMGTADTAARAVGSFLSGGMFAVGVAVPFIASALVGLALIGLAIPFLSAAGRDVRASAETVVAAGSG